MQLLTSFTFLITRGLHRAWQLTDPPTAYGGKGAQEYSQTAVMSTQLTTAATSKPEVRLAQAIARFEEDLSDEQKAAFSSGRRRSRDSPPNVNDVMRLTAQIDRRVAGKVGGGRCLGTRLVNVLEAVQQFAALGDIVVGGSQNMIACGVWSLVRLTLLMLVNGSCYFEKLSELFMTVGRSAPRHQAMALLYPHSKRLQSYLSEYFLVVVRICHDWLKLMQKSMLERLVSFVGEPDVRSYQSDFDRWANAIKEELSLLTAQQLQEQSHYLKILTKHSKSELHRKVLKDRLHILDSCSTYDHQTTWKEIRRYGNTSWFARQLEYQDWKIRNESCTLLYSGKLGSGKSVSLANMVDDLNLDRKDSPPVAYFFCRHDASESLQARTILGSLARQLLCTMQEVTMVVSENSSVVDPLVLDSKDILSLLRRNLNSTSRAYFILDGLDECDEDQKEDVVLRLQGIQGILPLLVCLSFRQEAGNVLALRLKHFAKPSVISIPEDNTDITEFIQSELERRVDLGKLRVGDPTLVLDIRKALVVGAKGMFLWVVLQINSLCIAKTDEYIRHALDNLPRDLPSTFSRILEQSAALGEEDEQRRTLELITAAYRPLTTNELREALSVVPGDSDWNLARMPNDIHAALACCGSLVTVDEETLSVKLVHHSVKQFLLSESEDFSGQTFTAKDANKTMTGIVTTYLSYGVSDTQVSNRVVPQIQHGAVPTAVVRSVLDPSSIQRLALRLLKSQKQSNSNVGQVLIREMQYFHTQPTSHFHFLSYSKSFWAKHIYRHPEHDPAIYRSLRRAVTRNNLAVNGRDSDGRTPLHLAAVKGYENLTKLISEAGADQEAKDNHQRTPLGHAAKEGQESVVRLLIEAGANKEAKDHNQLTPLHHAASEGQESVVRLLIEAGSNKEAKDHVRRTPLHRAALIGRESVVRILIEAGANKEAKDNHQRTPLHHAALIGQESVIRILIEAGANKEAKDNHQRTPLYLASQDMRKDTASLFQ